MYRLRLCLWIQDVGIIHVGKFEKEVFFNSLEQIRLKEESEEVINQKDKKIEKSERTQSDEVKID